jgi:signal transduction histidine kinase
MSPHAPLDEGIEFPGTGRGRALSKKLAEAHGGRVEGESTAGVRSRFSLLFSSLRAGRARAKE